MITTIKEFKDSLNENLLIPRRSKEERNLKLYQNNYRILNQNEIFKCEFFCIDYSYDFPESFKIDSLKLKKINGNIELNLKHIPKWLQNIIINGYFNCAEQQIKSLQHCPTIINGDFSCAVNSLRSLKGCATTVNGDFTCEYNYLKSLKGCPTTVNGNFNCRNNSKKFTVDEVKEVCNVKGKIIVNDNFN